MASDGVWVPDPDAEDMLYRAHPALDSPLCPRMKLLGDNLETMAEEVATILATDDPALYLKRVATLHGARRTHAPPARAHVARTHAPHGGPAAALRWRLTLCTPLRRAARALAARRAGQVHMYFCSINYVTGGGL